MIRGTLLLALAAALLSVSKPGLADDESIQGLAFLVLTNRGSQLSKIDNYVERVRVGEIPGMRLGYRDKGQSTVFASDSCVARPSCRVYKVEKVQLPDGTTTARARPLSRMEVAVLAGVNPAVVFLNEFGSGLVLAQAEVNRRAGGPSIASVINDIEHSKSDSGLKEMLKSPYHVFAFGGVMAIETANAEVAAELSVETSRAQAQAETDQVSAVYSQLKPAGSEEINGITALKYIAKNPQLPSQPVDGEQFIPTAAGIWIDPKKLVPLKQRIEGKVTSQGEARDFFVEVEMSDYRNPPGCGEMLQPFRRVMRMGGLMDDAQMAQMEEARKKLAEFDKQLAAMPPDQREMVERMTGSQMDTIRGLANGGVIESVEEIEEVICNPDLKELFSEPTTTVNLQSPPNLVRQIQRHLVTLGYEPGNTDGLVDTMTKVAISQFQAEHGLAVTGEPSTSLLDALTAQTASQGAG